MTDSPTAQIQALDDLLALAAVLEEMAAERYEVLAGIMREQGNGTVAALFDSLAQEERQHCDAVETLGGGTITGDSRDRWRLALARESEDAEALPLSPSAYQVLAFAVRNEERTFRHYSYIAAQAADPAVARTAEALAQEELGHAAVLRRARRHAFHVERANQGMATDRSTARDLPLTQDALCLAALAQEQSLLMLVDGSEGDNAPLRAITEGLIEQLQRTAEGLALKPGTGSARRKPDRAARGGSARPVDLRIELDRAFDLYDRVVDRTSDEDALTLAQTLAVATIERLNLLSGSPTSAEPPR